MGTNKPSLKPPTNLNPTPLAELEEDMHITFVHRIFLLLHLLIRVNSYSSLGQEDIPNEFIPEVSNGGKKTMSPVGDQPEKQCCGDPAIQPDLPPRRPSMPRPDGMKTDPTTTKLLASIDAGDPVKLKAALAQLKNAPRNVKQQVKESMEKAEDAAEQAISSPSPPLPSISSTPSPTPSSTPTPFPTLTQAIVGFDVQESSPSSTPIAPSPKIDQEEREEEKQIDTVLDNSLLIQGHSVVPIQDTPFVQKITFADDVPVMLSPRKKMFFQLDSPGISERAPMNIHFVATFRDRHGRECDGLSMRLRKFCGDDQSDPDLCAVPMLDYYSRSDGLPSSLIREKRLSKESITTDAFGALKTLELFEENPVTKKTDFPSWNCGCGQGVEMWTTPRKQTHQWWIEFDNSGRGDKSCQFTFRPHAVDICSGHGEWTPNEGCRCDLGYSGSYSGPTAVDPRKDDVNHVEFLEIEKAEAGRNDRTDRQNRQKRQDRKRGKINIQQAVMLRGVSSSKPTIDIDTSSTSSSSSSSVTLAQKMALDRVGNRPTEATPNELSGKYASQDTHNLGCTVDDRAPLRDPSIQKNLNLARLSVGLNPSKVVSTRSKKNVGTAKHHDDCYGTLTVNVLENMTDDEVIACTGRSREEVLAGSAYNSGKDNTIASDRYKNRTEVDKLDQTGWLDANSLRIVVGEVASEELGHELENRTKHSDISNGLATVRGAKKESLKDDVNVKKLVA